MNFKSIGTARDLLDFANDVELCCKDVLSFVRVYAMYKVTGERLVGSFGPASITTLMMSRK